MFAEWRDKWQDGVKIASITLQEEGGDDEEEKDLLTHFMNREVGVTFSVGEKDSYSKNDDESKRRDGNKKGEVEIWHKRGSSQKRRKFLFLEDKKSISSSSISDITLEDEKTIILHLNLNQEEESSNFNQHLLYFDAPSRIAGEVFYQLIAPYI